MVLIKIINLIINYKLVYELLLSGKIIIIIMINTVGKEL